MYTSQLFVVSRFQTGSKFRDCLGSWLYIYKISLTSFGWFQKKNLPFFGKLTAHELVQDFVNQPDLAFTTRQILLITS